MHGNRPFCINEYSATPYSKNKTKTNKQTTKQNQKKNLKTHIEPTTNHTLKTPQKKQNNTTMPQKKKTHHIHTTT